MKTFFPVLILFFSTMISGQTPDYQSISKKLFNKSVQISRDSEKVILQGKTCLEIESEIENLKKWTEKLGEKSGKTTCSCIKNHCSSDVTDILPKLVKSTQSTCSAFDGPNCWNGVLVGSKLTSHLRYTSSEEMSFWMKSPLCKEKQKDEPLLPGDIVAIRDELDDEVHGFIHISENLSYSKNGMSKQSPYSLQSPDKVYELYGVKKDCRNLISNKISYNCKNYSKIYTCSSMEDYLKAHPIKDKASKKTWDALEALDCDISVMTFSKSPQTELKSLMMESVRAIIVDASSELQGDLTSEERFIWKGISQKAKSVFSQLESIK